MILIYSKSVLTAVHPTKGERLNENTRNKKLIQITIVLPSLDDDDAAKF